MKSSATTEKIANSTKSDGNIKLPTIKAMPSSAPADIIKTHEKTTSLPLISRKQILVDPAKFSIPVDLKKIPESIASNKHNTIGDIHANTIKMLAFLKALNVVSLDDKSYSNLIEIYFKYSDANPYSKLYLNDQKKPEVIFNPKFEGTAVPSTEFKENLAQCKVVDAKKLVRFIGDVLADRGANDYFTLLLLAVVQDANIEILLSNHDLEFIIQYEKNILMDQSKDSYINHDACRSLFTLKNAFAYNEIKMDEVKNLVEKYYKPKLKLLSYSLDVTTNTINIYSHAPICLKTIMSMATKLKINFIENEIYASPLNLASLIDQINGQFAKIRDRNEIHTLVDLWKVRPGKPPSHVTVDNPIERSTWNRVITNDDIIENEKANYNIHFRFGHTQTVSRPGYFQYDNTLGQPELSKGDLVYCASNSASNANSAENASSKIPTKFTTTLSDKLMTMFPAGSKETNSKNSTNQNSKESGQVVNNTISS